MVRKSFSAKAQKEFLELLEGQIETLKEQLNKSLFKGK